MLFGALRRFVTEDFKGALGAFTPCFIDVVVLGASNLFCLVHRLHASPSQLILLWPLATAATAYKVCDVTCCVA